MAKTEIDSEAVMSALRSGKFDIGDNPYGVMTSISDYTTSIFTAIGELQKNWASAVQDVGDYIDVFKGLTMPEGDELTNLSTDLGEGNSASLRGVNTFLNVRSGVGTNKEVVGSLTNGTAFTVLGASGKDTNGTTWYHVKYKDSNGQEVDGYVSGDYINVDSSSFDSSPPAGATAGTQTGAAASSNGGAGSVGTSNGGSTSSSSGGSSGNTSGSASSSGNKQLTGVVSNIKDVGSHLNIRSTADGSNTGNIVGGLSNGDKIEILGEENGFYRIKTSSGIGYVSKDYVTLPKNSVIPHTTIEIPAKTTVSLKDINTNLNFRSAPNSNNPNNIISGIKSGTELDVVGRSGDWTKVKYNNQEGWVYTKYLTK